MPILNYTTKLSEAQTVTQIQQMLAAKGASSVSVEYGTGGVVTAITFTLNVADKPLTFRLPCNVEGVYAVLQKERGIEKRYQTKEHARRVAWRIIKDWVEAQLALVEARQAQMAEVFFPYAIDSTGQTAFKSFMDAQSKQLTSGDE